MPGSLLIDMNALIFLNIFLFISTIFSCCVSEKDYPLMAVGSETVPAAHAPIPLPAMAYYPWLWQPSPVNTLGIEVTNIHLYISQIPFMSPNKAQHTEK